MVCRVWEEAEPLRAAELGPRELPSFANKDRQGTTEESGPSEPVFRAVFNV